MKQGTLFIVATPIGNLEDITLRAIRVLREVDLIAAEDTRRTAILLRHYGIETPVTSLHDHNEREKSGTLVSRLIQGSSIAYVSDAGTPGISDPGFVFLREALAGSIEVVAIPGPSSVIAALSVSGLPMDSFSFFGFPPSRSAKRRQFLESLEERTETLVFFESPRRLQSSLRDMLEILGNREITISRELTKLHEETMRGTLSAVMERIGDAPVRGEVTMVLEGNRTGPRRPSPEALWGLYLDAAKDGALSTRDGVARVARETGIPKKDVYRIVLENLKDR
ncbi:MAG: 16S rRNA (cytidine(1402)-2'-O)-methyltransferase [Syntrophales bacterium]|jgi:16S rRNA (cytidine1402-2'-O)-methyltransferase|nr:16S rRNA (cytidine(1402)-2'-O)-methyltransferase [Syntrophales bacterium]MCK9528879.1 16S rRNA (cytidine(1402)-2'-O)-methyltransferase [Syntrophales bacterium]MDX9922957.1 16S rRNA (cytidine(1402)-2'-O)-methyltransferase [Syntrophales bacterium]